jgi:hypothetical protein
MELTAILPPNDAMIDFDLLDCAVRGPEISIIEDKALSRRIGKAANCHCRLRKAGSTCVLILKICWRTPFLHRSPAVGK